MFRRQLKISYGLFKAALTLSTYTSACSNLLLELDHLLELLVLTFEDKATDANMRTRLVKLLIACCLHIYNSVLLLVLLL